MQSIVVGLLFKSVVITFIGLLLIAMTPFLLKRYDAKWLYYSWCLILVGFVWPFSFKLPTTIIHLQEPAQLPPMNMVPVKSSEVTLISSSVEMISSFSIWQVLIVLWIAGLVMFLAIHLARHYRFMQTLNRWGQTVTAPRTIQLLEQLTQEMAIKKTIQLKQCSCIDSPMLTGLIKQTIWLPPHTYGDEQLRMVLQHELVHVQRKDVWYKAFLLLVSSVHWFNPLLYRFAQEMDYLCERACDDGLIKNMDHHLRKVYSQTILQSVKAKRTPAIFSTNFLGNTHTLQKRIYAIMERRNKKSAIAVFVLFITMTIGGAAVSSSFAIANTPINYVDETFMKASILNGASRGNFSTDYFIIEAGALLQEPLPNAERYQNNLTAGVIATEARYRYPIDIVHEQYGQKYTTVLHIDYDYKLLAPIEHAELNQLIASYLSPFHELKSISFTDFIKPNYLERRLQQYIQRIDQQNIDERVAFTFSFSGLVTNNNHFPGLMHYYPIMTTPRD